MGIREKLWIGIGALLAVLLLASLSAIWVISRGNRAIEAVFRNNGDAVFYMHELTDGLDVIQGQLKASLAGKGVQNGDWLAQSEAKVERSLAGEANCLSELGEQEAWVNLGQAWRNYKLAYRRCFGAGWDLEKRRRYVDDVLEPQFLGMKSLAWQIAGLNLKNTSFRDHGRREAWAEERWMVLLLLSGVALGVGFVLMAGRAILDPILELTRSVQEIEKGNLDLTVPVKSKDELGQLGTAFNSMAGRLKVFERSVRARLLRTRKTTQMAINSFSDPVAVLSLSGIIDMCNLAAEELFDLRPGMALGDSQLSRLDSLLPPVLQLGQAYEPKGYAEAFQSPHRGREKFMLPRLVPVLDANKQVVGVTLFLEDVTALRKLDDMKSGLLATVSHELKNPLTSLRLATHFLLEPAPGPLTEKQRELALTVQKESDRLHVILEELLELGRSEAGKELLQVTLQSPRSLVLESVVSMAVGLRSKKLKLVLDVDDDLPDILVDTKRIRHVFSNLFENAIKYSFPDGQVRVGAALEGKAVRFWVKDNGPGVPEIYKGRIFDRYFRIPGRGKGNGSGLGLAIAKDIVELHGGFLQVESLEGVGTTFSFVIPMDGVPLAPKA